MRSLIAPSSYLAFCAIEKTCAVPVLPAIEYGAPAAERDAVPPCVTANMPAMARSQFLASPTSGPADSLVATGATLRVTAPICLPAILDIAIYLFVNAMTTVSSVIFLYAPDTKLASVAAVNIEEAGTTAAAAALCVVIVLTSAGVKAVHVVADRFLLGRLQAWRRR